MPDELYRYDQLPTPSSIRVIRVDKVDGRGLVHCSIKTIDLNDEPCYYAVSYTWGNPYSESYLSREVREEYSKKYDWPHREAILLSGRALHVGRGGYDALLCMPNDPRASQSGNESENSTPDERSHSWRWIDQICIDQGNVEERGSQVAIMDQIYEKAKFTLIWLGPADIYTEAAVQTIGSLSRGFVSWGHDSEIEPYKEQNDDVYVKAGIPYVSMAQWTALVVLFLRPYFRRTWIIQENVLSRTIFGYCGSHEIPWSEFCHVAQEIFSRQKDLGRVTSTAFIDTSKPLVSIESEVVYLKQWGERFNQDNESQITRQTSLENLMLDTWTFHVTDPRDKLFGLYGLLIKRTVVNWQPDYTKSVQRVFALATTEIIQQSKTLSILSAIIDLSLRKIHDLPSWVPDYSVPFTNMMCTGFNASANFPVKPFSHPAWNTLQVSGVKIDKVLRMGNTTSAPLDPYMFFDPAWMDLALLVQHPYHNGQARTEALWRTLCADQKPDGSSPAPIQYGHFFHEMLCSLMCSKPADTNPASDDKENPLESGLNSVRELWSSPPISSMSPEHLERSCKAPGTRLNRPESPDMLHLLIQLKFLETAEKRAWTPSLVDLDNFTHWQGLPPWDGDNTHLSLDKQESISAFRSKRGRRRLFVTENRYLGLGPASMVEGDEIWVLAGSGASFILRRMGQGNSFQIIGEAYVHGAMNGEVIAGLDVADILLV